MYTNPTAKEPTLSEDATVVLALARTSLPFAATRAEEGERWLRVLRMHGQVGVALQGLGVGEASLASARDGRHARVRWEGGRRHDETVTDVCCRALELAHRTGADTVGTLHILSAVLAVYGTAPPATRSWPSWASSRRSPGELVVEGLPPRPRPDPTARGGAHGISPLDGASETGAVRAARPTRPCGSSSRFQLVSSSPSFSGLWPAVEATRTC